MIVGASGRMGAATFIESALKDVAVELVAAMISRVLRRLGRGCRRVGRRAVGLQCGPGDTEAAIAAADGRIDFTRPEGTLEHLAKFVAVTRSGVVIGTTGIDDIGKQATKTLPVISRSCSSRI